MMGSLGQARAACESMTPDGSCFVRLGSNRYAQGAIGLKVNTQLHMLSRMQHIKLVCDDL